MNKRYLVIIVSVLLVLSGGYILVYYCVNAHIGAYHFDMVYKGRTVGKITVEIEPAVIPQFVHWEKFPYFETWWFHKGGYTVSDVTDKEFTYLEKRYRMIYNRAGIFDYEYFDCGCDYTRIEFYGSVPTKFGFGDEVTTYFQLR